MGKNVFYPEFTLKKVKKVVYGKSAKKPGNGYLCRKLQGIDYLV